MPTTQSHDPKEQVDHPRHYNQHPSGVECIEIIEHMPCNVGNAVKYIWRFGLKTSSDPLRDLRSARWYVRREITRRERFASHPQSEDVSQWQRVALWGPLAEKIIADAKVRETADLLAFCLGDLLREDLEGLAKRLEKTIVGLVG
jgi:hypothetical protein